MLESVSRRANNKKVSEMTLNARSLAERLGADESNPQRMYEVRMALIDAGVREGQITEDTAERMRRQAREEFNVETIH